MSDLVIPKRDVVFKKLFGVKGREAITKSFLSSILEININSINLDVGTEFLPDKIDGK